MTHMEKTIYQLEQTAAFLQRFGFSGFENIRDVIAMLKEQETVGIERTNKNVHKEKIEKGLNLCMDISAPCDECPYKDIRDCNLEMVKDALVLIDIQYNLILELQNLISVGTKMMNGDET